jgi:hypothetical protein
VCRVLSAVLAAIDAVGRASRCTHAVLLLCGCDALLTHCTLLLLLLLPLQPSKCDVECMTVARACAQVSDELDLSDLSEALFKGHKRSALSSEACHESTNVCRKKPPPVPKVGGRAHSCANSCATAACWRWCAIAYCLGAPAVCASPRVARQHSYSVAACRGQPSIVQCAAGLVTRPAVIQAHPIAIFCHCHQPGVSSADYVWDPDIV